MDVSSSAVGVTGIAGAAGHGYGVGSVRATAWSPKLAAALWQRLRPAVPSVRFLGIELPDGSVGRAPYLLPYVDPAARCCVPPREIHAFSARVWALNEHTFAGSGLRVRDLPRPTRATFAWLGEDHLLEDVCRWYIERLARVSPIVRVSPPRA